jgi:uncharacterized protein (AIM24 family)
MPFCTNCGTRLDVDCHFCTGCGRSLGNGGDPTEAAAAAAAAAPAPEPLEYTIQGDTLQVVRILLKPGQEVYADAGKMVYKFPEVGWASRAAGILGESLFLTHFSATSPSEVGFAGGCPGRIQAFDLTAGQSVLVERSGFICAQSTSRLDITPLHKPGAGLVLERLTGPGTAFIHAAGDSIEFNLNPGQVIQVDAGCIVAFDESVGLDIQPAEGIQTSLARGAGLSLAALTGPGRVVIQTLHREPSPVPAGRDEG